MTAAIWILAGSHAILTACGIVGILFRLIDEKRFRRVQGRFEDGDSERFGRAYRVATGRRKRARAWIETVCTDFTAKETRKEGE